MSDSSNQAPRPENKTRKLAFARKGGPGGPLFVCSFCWLCVALCGSLWLSVALCGFCILLCVFRLLASVACSSWLLWLSALGFRGFLAYVSSGFCYFFCFRLLWFCVFFCGSLPARWGSLDFNKGATHSHPLLLLPSSSHLLLCQFAEPHISSSGQYCPLDPNLILRGPDAVGWAWARTERMAE